MNKLAFTDVCANELFNHADCLKRLENEYTKESKVANEDNIIAWIKAFNFNIVKDHIYNHNAKSPCFIFNAKHLEKMYIDKLEPNDISVTSYVKRLSTRLTNSINNLIAKSVDILVSTVCFIVLEAPRTLKKVCLVAINC